MPISHRNVILIGMPGAGKTTLGRLLAPRWGWQFLDGDPLIVSRHGKSLDELQKELGRAGFLDLEAATLQELHVDRAIIAPGGSIVYRDEAMRHLRRLGTVVYLQVAEAEIEQRIGDLRARGVVIAPGQTVLDLYHERQPLYLKYAHAVVPLRGMNPAASADELAAFLESTPVPPAE